MLNLEDREILFNFISACNLLISRIVKQSDLDEVYRQLIKMTKLIEENYGLELISSNIHLSLYIRQCCLDYSLPYAY